MAINLNKVTLEKQGDSHKIDLSKGTKSNKEIIINLNWTQQTSKTGNIFSRLWGGNNSIDLDLGCFFELNDGQKSVIDGLQFAHGQGGPKEQLTKQGRYTDVPWVWHSGDDRGTSLGSGENLLVNPKGLNDLKRIIVYCFIYEGVAKWDETNAVVTIQVPDNPDIVVEMGKQFSSHKFCAIAEIDFESENVITVRKLVTFHNGHGECDKVYNWGMRWSAGKK